MVEVGLTVVEPNAATVPIPLSIETVVASEVVHVSVAWFPGVMVDGETERVAVVTAGGNEGSSATPRQPDIRPSERHTAMNDKHLVGKRTLHHPLAHGRDHGRNMTSSLTEQKSESRADSSDSKFQPAFGCSFLCARCFTCQLIRHLTIGGLLLRRHYPKSPFSAAV